jgi:hypothetical protein
MTNPTSNPSSRTSFPLGQAAFVKIPNRIRRTCVGPQTPESLAILVSRDTSICLFSIAKQRWQSETP